MPHPTQGFKDAIPFREIWRKTPGDFYSPNLSVREDGEAFRLDKGGSVVTLPFEELHRLAWNRVQAEPARPRSEAEGSNPPSSPGVVEGDETLREALDLEAIEKRAETAAPSDSWYIHRVAVPALIQEVRRLQAPVDAGELARAFRNTEEGAAVFRVYEAAIAFVEDSSEETSNALFEAVEEPQGGEGSGSPKGSPGGAA